jgi:hypothetical protein
LGVLGAAVLLGSAKRIVRRCTYSRGILLACGVAVLVNVRPYEGAVLCSGVGIWLLLSLMRNQRSSLLLLLTAALPVLLLTFAAMAYYNWRLTGSALTMPYAIHAAQYDSAPPFWFQPSRPKWDYRHENLLNFHVWELNTYLDMQDAGLRLRVLGQRLRVLFFWFFDLSMIALLWIVPVFRRRSFRPVLLFSGLLLVAFMLTTWLNSNYTSEAVPIYLIILTACLRQLRPAVFPRTTLPVGPLLILFLAIGTFAWALQDVQPFELNDSDYGYTRAQIMSDLQSRGGRHLIFVHYSAQHPRAEEWIYNDSDIPNSQVIWAHDMGTTENQHLVDVYGGRELWELDVDVKPQRLVPKERTAR